MMNIGCSIRMTIRLLVCTFWRSWLQLIRNVWLAIGRTIPILMFSTRLTISLKSGLSPESITIAIQCKKSTNFSSSSTAILSKCLIICQGNQRKIKWNVSSNARNARKNCHQGSSCHGNIWNTVWLPSWTISSREPQRLWLDRIIKNRRYGISSLPVTIWKKSECSPWAIRQSRYTLEVTRWVDFAFWLRQVVRTSFLKRKSLTAINFAISRAIRSNR